MIKGFDLSYEVCNCKKVSIEDLIKAINEKKSRTLGDLQDTTGAGTECRYCIFEEGDFGKIKKNIYCKDVLTEVLNG